jgi:hypothetical protein
MVDKTQIDRDFRLFFRVTGKYTISDTGMIDVYGDLNARDTFPGPHLPVQLGTVNGDCDLESQDNLTDLQGAPHTVKGTFIVIADQLISLKGAPSHVTRNCVIRSNNLSSLEHLPLTAQALRLNMSPQLPLLRLTERSYPIVWGYPTSLGGMSNTQMRTATEIITKYAGTGKAGALKAAAELIKADCKANARW